MVTGGAALPSARRVTVKAGGEDLSACTMASATAAVGVIRSYYSGVRGAAHITEQEFKRELALTLFQQERFTLASASGLAEMSQREFQRLLADRRITIHYGIEEFGQDMDTLRQLGRL